MLPESLTIYLSKTMDISIRGTKKELLNIERKLKKLGVKDEAWWNEDYREKETTVYIITCGMLDITNPIYSYFSHPGVCGEKRYDYAEGLKFLNELIKQQKDAEKSKGNASKS